MVFKKHYKRFTCDIRFTIKHSIGSFIFRFSQLLLKAFRTDKIKQKMLTLSNIIVCPQQKMYNFLDEPSSSYRHCSDVLHIDPFICLYVQFISVTVQLNANPSQWSTEPLSVNIIQYSTICTFISIL